MKATSELNRPKLKKKREKKKSLVGEVLVASLARAEELVAS